MRAISRVAVLVACVGASTCADPLPTTGALIVDITGLPASVLATVSVRGPADFRRTIQGTTTLESLAPGEYSVSAGMISTAEALYQPDVLTRVVTVVAGKTEAVGLAFQLASGSIDVVATGLPAGVAPLITVNGPSYYRVFAGSGVIAPIPPGEYRVRADTFAAPNGDRFGAAVLEHGVTIVASSVPVPLSVAYGAASGSLSIRVNNLSVTATDAVSVTGPAGFARQISASTTLRGLIPGTYTVTPREVMQCPNLYTPLASAQSFEVALGQVAEALVDYRESLLGPETLNLSIATAYMTQAVQNVTGTLPIVAGRPALLRVFGVANQCNAATPGVKIRFSDGDSLIVRAPEASVRFAAEPSLLSTSWNAMLPAERVKAGLTFVAEIDPENSIPEVNESDNRYPASGQSSTVVREEPPLDITFVPITQTGVTGNVHSGNLHEYLEATRQMLPVGRINTSVAPPYTTQVVLGNGSASAFISILEELERKRVNDGSASHYYGVVTPAPGVNFVQVGGIAYVGGRAAVSVTVGWFFNVRQATEIVAHELAHNFGQRHAPCGSAGGLDPSYPYTGGVIGVTAYDLSNALQASDVIVKPRSTPDIMGYCVDPWISDYMYERILRFRNPQIATASAAQSRTLTLLISGMTSPDSMRLDPVFEVRTIPSVPQTSGATHAVEGYAADGALLFRVPFVPLAADHAEPGARYFTLAVPVSEDAVQRLARVELVANGRRTARGSTNAGARLRLLAPDAAAAGVSAASRGSDVVEVLWDHDRWPAVLVRDATSGALLAVGRNGRATVATRAGTVELVLSDGARSITLVARVDGR